MKAFSLWIKDRPGTSGRMMTQHSTRLEAIEEATKMAFRNQCDVEVHQLGLGTIVTLRPDGTSILPGIPLPVGSSCRPQSPTVAGGERIARRDTPPATASAPVVTQIHHFKATIPAETVRAIKLERAGGALVRDVAKKYGVAIGYVSRVCRGQMRREVVV